jgi:hypothetical protein
MTNDYHQFLSEQGEKTVQEIVVHEHARHFEESKTKLLAKWQEEFALLPNTCRING